MKILFVPLQDIVKRRQDFFAPQWNAENENEESDGNKIIGRSATPTAAADQTGGQDQTTSGGYP